MAPKKYRQKIKQQKQSQATPHEHPHHHKKGKDRRSLYLLIVAVVIVVIVIGAIAASGLTGNNGGSSSNSTATPSPSSSATSDSSYINSTFVFFHTSMGNFTVQLRNDMPITTGNFIKLVQEGVYNGSTFHRVISDFMIQGGIPANGQTVSTIQDEFTSTNHNYYGTIAMANTGAANSGSSQFFINTANNNLQSASDGTPFDNHYVAFGKVAYGMDTVLAISNVQVNSSDKPVQDVTIIGASVLNV
jgi:peptidylprolyl isomerase